MRSAFLAEAERVAGQLTGAALRHGGKATWLADEMDETGSDWQPTLRTLGPDLGAGTAGVALFLACVWRCTRRPPLDVLAGEATMHSLAGADDLVRHRRLGFHDGALGVVWAALVTGAILGRDDLLAAAVDHGRAAVEAAAAAPPRASDPGLLGGEAGVLLGLRALAGATPFATSPFGASPAGVSPKGASAGGTALSGAAAGTARIVADRLMAMGPTPEGADGGRVGLAAGASGMLLALADDSPAAPATTRTLMNLARAERSRYVAGAGWSAPSAHAWSPDAAVPDTSWCSGAAGVGAARLAAYASTGELVLLAELGAAIELLRPHLAAADPADASVCHGSAGPLDLLVAAAQVLREPAHLAAARRAGRTLLEGSRRLGAYGCAFGPGARNPSLLYGVAGTGMVLLRLHDPSAGPSLTCPPAGRLAQSVAPAGRHHPRGVSGGT